MGAALRLNCPGFSRLAGGDQQVIRLEKGKLLRFATIATIVKHDSKILQINQAALSMLSHIALALLAHTYNCFFLWFLLREGFTEKIK